MGVNDLNGISISYLDCDEVCLNCKWWAIDDNLNVVCIKGQGYTDPDDTCSAFYYQGSRDDDLDGEIEKRQKLHWHYNDK